MNTSYFLTSWCALNGEYSSLKECIQRVRVPDALRERGSIASRKGVAGDRRSEVSETAKAGTDEQERHTEAE